MLLGEARELVVKFGPHGRGGDGAELVGGYLDSDVEGAALPDLDDGGPRALGMRAGEEVSDEFDGVLRGGKTDALRRWVARAGARVGGEIGGEVGGEPVFAAHERYEPFDGEPQMCAALVVRNGMDFVDDDGANAA